MAATSPARPPTAALSVESIVAVESPREFRLHPRDRVVAYVAEAAGARQLFTLNLRGGHPTQLTASEKAVSDPQWSPDGRRLAYVRDDEIWVVEADGSRSTRVVAKPGGGTSPRWSPDGGRLAFLSRRRGWSQVWVIAAPVPRRGRPAHDPKPPVAIAVTATGLDVGSFEWAPDGARLAVMARHDPTHPVASEIAIVDVASGALEIVAGTDGCATGGRWLPDGSLLYVSDESGWFQVVRRSPDGRDRIVLTDGEREHGEPGGGFGHVPLASPDGTRFVHIEVHDGFQDLVVASMAAEAAPKRGRGRPPKSPRTVAAAGRGQRIDPFDGVWRAIGWLADGAWIAAIGESETRPQDLWLLPVPGVAPEDARPRQVTDSLPAVLRPALAPGRAARTERFAFTARDGLRIEGTVHRPVAADGKRGSRRVPVVIYPHGGPTGQTFRLFVAVQAAARGRGLRRRRRGLPRARPATAARSARPTTTSGATPTSTTSSMAPAGPPDQPWADGRLAIYGGSYGGYVVLCALVEEPAMWSAGVDLFGDSEIAESYPARRSAGPARPAPDDGLARRRAADRRRSGAGRRSIAPSASRPRCCCSTAARTSGSSRS